MMDMTFNQESNSKALAHDIRGILTIARLAVDRLMLHEDRSVRKHCALVEQIIDRATSYCADTVSDPRYIKDEIISSAVLIEGVDLILKPLAEEYGVDYKTVFLDADIPAKVYTKLHRILINLGRNAIYAQKGQKESRLLILADSDDKEIIINMIDKGPGIPEPVMEELLSRASNKTITNKAYLGMGLTSSFAFAHNLGGETKLIKSDGMGTHFRIQVPLDRK